MVFEMMYEDRNWLFTEYVEKGKTMLKIADGLDVPYYIIYYWMKKHNIKRRDNPGAFKKGHKLSVEARRKKSKGLRGRILPEEVKRKISETKLAMHFRHSEETKKKLSEIAKRREVNPGAGSMLGKKHTEEAKRKIGIASKRNYDIRGFSDGMGGIGKKHPMYGRRHSKESRVKMSVSRRGLDVEDWDGFISYEPYCPAFNFEKKEEIRNKYNRTCVVSGISVLQNGRRLDVDHVDENKMQGCYGIKWRLVPLTHWVHLKMNGIQSHLLLELLLLGNKNAEMNYEF